MLKRVATKTLELLLGAAEFSMERTDEFSARIATSSASHALLMTLFWCLFLVLLGALFFGSLLFVLVCWVWLRRRLI